jgi:3',5'-nucleoside bisphosphate phosphatase
MNKIIDMHIHSNYSDGELSPNELIKLAKEKGIGTISITDHDNILGNKSIVYDEKIEGIRIIPGIELSAKVPKGRMHILGYNIDLNNIILNKKMNELRNNSINSVLSLVEQIKKDYGIIFNYEEIKELVNANHNLGRPDLAKLCIKNGYANNVQDAFDKYLIEAYKKTRGHNKGLTYYECIDLILISGGIPVLAHPNTLHLSDEELRLLIKDMINNGLKGIEVYHSNHSLNEVNKYLEIANEFGLLISGGSDYHGINVKPDIEMGTGIKNNLKIKQLTLLNNIK